MSGWEQKPLSEGVRHVSKASEGPVRTAMERERGKEGEGEGGEREVGETKH